MLTGWRPEQETRGESTSRSLSRGTRTEKGRARMDIHILEPAYAVRKVLTAREQLFLLPGLLARIFCRRGLPQICRQAGLPRVAAGPADPRIGAGFGGADHGFPT